MARLAPGRYFAVVLAEFRLAKIVDGCPHWAEVAVEVSPADEDRVRVGGDPYGWRREVYGPDAWIGGVEDEGMLAEAVEGARLALGEHTGGRHEVTVTVVRNSNVDTCPGDVRFAALHATARALGFVPADGPATRLVRPAPWSAA